MRAAIWNIRIDAATGEAVQALTAVGISSLVLKGPALSDWYPPDTARTYVDGDIWVSPGDFSGAELTLRRLGFVPDIDERGLPDWWRQHATPWRRQRDGTAIDLHRFLQGTGADPAETWETLWRERQPLHVGGVDAYRPSAAGRALFVALHCAHHGNDGTAALTHLTAGLAVADQQVWVEAGALAAKLDAVDAFAAGLRLLPEGAELAERLELPRNRSVYVALHPATAPLLSLGFERVAQARGWRRLEILVRAVFPPPGFLRHWWPPAAWSPAMLVIGYLYRPFWLLRRAPKGLGAWLAARREVRANKS
jgi:hypothetical protein